MNEKLFKRENGAITEYLFYCPACKRVHMFTVPECTFNNNLEKPTVGQSILVFANTTEQVRCHSTIKDGKITYRNDSEHNMKGKTVDLPVWEETK